MMRQSIHRPGVLRAGLLAGAALLFAGGPAFAGTTDVAEADGSGAAGLEEVVVTAQKRVTNVQSTPIAISVMGSSDLERRHVQSIEDLSDGSIPSLRAAPFFARNSALTVGMRGVGASSDANQPARDQAVGVYIDGVYLGRAQGLGSALYDVDHIEVLKGPQGTLFGRNTEGGAISIVTKAPTGRFGMDTTVGAGDHDSYKAETHINLPAFHDLSIKVDGVISKRDGTVGNPGTSGQPDFNSYDKRGFHIQGLWRPRDDFSADYAFDDSYDGTTPYYVQLLEKGVLALPPLFKLQPERAKDANVGVPLQLSVGKTSGHRLTLDWKATPSLEVKSISSYRDLTQTQFDNAEEMLSAFRPNGQFSRYSLANVYQNQYSEELQLIGNVRQVDFVAGAFYYHEWVRDNAQTPNSMQFNATGTAATPLPLDLTAVPYDRASHVTTDSYGVFGQATWTPPVLNNIVHLTVGGRLTRDHRQGSLDTINGAVPSYVDPTGKTITGIIPLDKSWTRFDPLVNLAVDATEDVHLYARWSTGYKAGGANSRSLTYRPFDPETVSMYELGAKTEFWDRRARFNASAFYGDLKDEQVDFTVFFTGNNNRGTLETTNAATGKTQGFDMDLTVAPMPGLTLSASYAYTKVSLSQAFNPFTGGQSNIYPLYTPENAASVAVDYEREALGVTFSGHLDASYSDGQITGTTDPTLSDKSFIVNGRVALSDIRLTDGATLQLSLWSRNLFNEQHAFLRSFNAVLGTYGIFNEPRTFGAEAKIRF